MLETISVKNIALIDELSLDFNAHLNVLSGETGAGKSILIGALSFLLGGKVTADIIRTGTAEAAVSGTFYLANTHPEAAAWLNERGIEPENNRILLRRTLKENGRGSIWIQDAQVSRSELEEFTSFLVDIHGQHDHQSLFKTAEHRRFLDSYAGILDEVREFSVLYTRLAEIKAKLETIRRSEKERTERTDYLAFVIDEIDNARLQPEEDETLEAEETKLCQYEKLYEQADALQNLCTQEQGIVPQLKRLQHISESVTAIDPTVHEYAERIENAYYEMQDIGEFFSSYLSKLVFDPNRLEQVQERLSLINKLKKKYGATIKDILAYREASQAELDSLGESEQDKTALEKEIPALESKLFAAGTALSQKRKAAAAELQRKIQDTLTRLGMPKVVFTVQVTAAEPNGNKQIAGMYGFDSVEFLISTNPGEPVKPLNKIASGGELSRVMLALKTVLTAADEADTLVFDEIDTGIGGEVARTVAEHLKSLAGNKQILCITHLAVIAAAADTHIKILKMQSDNASRTSAQTIDGEARIEEIARMLAGDEVSTASRIHAKELLSRYGSIG
ncbi:DNA repair protein RecN [Treponema vincentii ATCC 35580]|uniref:DNA repair protein RecN n=1 Tax=Treponema vincentii ATCC 35580 TaxID=596324 RepID=C8PS58_9SPIR|nr:DNA repair protein RecN [Treponema vincentii]EEV19728.1 DNA repair protein RecN [Treponema vincentii ATCC 35580]